MVIPRSTQRAARNKTMRDGEILRADRAQTKPPADAVKDRRRSANKAARASRKGNR